MCDNFVLQMCFQNQLLLINQHYIAIAVRLFFLLFLIGLCFTLFSVSHSLFVTVILVSSMTQHQFRNSRFECITQTQKVTYIESGLAELKHTCIGSPYDHILLGCRMVSSATAKHYAICHSLISVIGCSQYLTGQFALICMSILQFCIRESACIQDLLFCGFLRQSARLFAVLQK